MPRPRPCPRSRSVAPSLRPFVAPLLHLLALLLLLSPTAALAADLWATVVDEHGREHHGRLVEQDTFKVVLEVHFGGITMQRTFAKGALRSFTIEEPAEDDGAEQPDDHRRPADDRGGYAVVPLQGDFGVEITPNFFRELLDRAGDTRAEAVVVHIDSPGGLVVALDETRDTLEDLADEHDLTVAFYVDGEAYSAAALLCMSRPHLYLGDGARIGAAVPISFNETGAVSAADAKFTAAFKADWRQHAADAGRNPLIVDAMIDMTAELWADTSANPWALHGSRPADVEPEHLVMIDGPETVLALTADQARSIGLADGSADEPEDVARLLDLHRPHRIAFDGERFSDIYFRRLRNNLGLIDNAVRDFNSAVRGVQSAGDEFRARRELRRMIGNLRKAVRLAEELDYVRFHLLTQGVTADQLDALADELAVILSQR